MKYLFHFCLALPTLGGPWQQNIGDSSVTRKVGNLWSIVYGHGVCGQPGAVPTPESGCVRSMAGVDDAAPSVSCCVVVCSRFGDSLRSEKRNVSKLALTITERQMKLGMRAIDGQ